MENIWAPWRIHYILGKKEKGCFLCIKKTRGYRERRFILAENEHAFVILNKYPYTAGHLMVVPWRHVFDLEALTPEELAGTFELVKLASARLRKAIRPDGLNIGINLGKTAGSSSEEHLHIHIVARWNGDHNFMPVMSNTMVMPEALKSTYQRLLPYFQATPQKKFR
jgi:ATP adenylyltransferase